MNLWTWKTWKDRPYLVCSLLPQPHGFFTSHFYPQTPESLVSVIAPSAQVYRVKQVHSADVLMADEVARKIACENEDAIAASHPPLASKTPTPLPLADGVISDQPQQSVWACSADCTPALISDVVTGQVAAVHAGWRGTAQKILPAAVSRLMAAGSEIQNLRVALGPAIDGRVYQVGKDVAAEVGLSVAGHLSETALIDHLMSIESPPLLADDHTERVRLDVRRINQMQLEQMGLGADQIAIAPHCTYQDPDNFFSYRRTQEKKVQWSGIVSC
ncbi:MAG: peptidoglycan editing factor PgeF [Phormidesmis sp.]